MNTPTLSAELRSLITRQVERARPHELISIVTALTELDEITETAATIAAPAQASTDRFRILDERQVLDESTGLVWTRSTLSIGRMNFAQAHSACASLRDGGFDTWRLPTIRELLSLVDYEAHDPAIAKGVFECESAWYWSSTFTHENPSVYAWGVAFDSGYAGWGSQSNCGFVRAVRPSQF